MRLFTKKEIIEYQVVKWINESPEFGIDWRSYLKDTNFYIQGMIKSEEYQALHWLDELISVYDLEDLKSLE